MPRKLSLPLTRDDATTVGQPTVDSVRKRLGGRASSDAGPGELVSFATGGSARLGVVLFAKGDELAVWVGEGIVRRTSRAEAKGVKGAAPAELASVATDARVFGSLTEGQLVRYEPGTGELDEGMLIEKCRFGGL